MIQPKNMSLTTMPQQKRTETTNREIDRQVLEIVSRVRGEGDAALIALTEAFDKVALDATQLRCTKEELDFGTSSLSDALKNVLQNAADNIRSFHEKAMPRNWFSTNEQGSVLGQRQTPVDSVGIYVPSGSAPLASTVLMTAIPAKVAGVKNIVVVTPPEADGTIHQGILAACAIAGVDEVYKIGGAQAVAALAYGTATVPKVDKIVGPGNVYVATAKRHVYGDVDIDMIAGPSEIVVVADEGASPRVIAADLLSQAEHDPMASSVLLTSSMELATEVSSELERQLADLPRAAIARKSLESYGGLYVFPSLEEAISAVNVLAPEHLELQVAEPYAYLDQIRHAGAIFIGAYSAESVGDYFAGPSHVLPTNGTARFSSPLSVEDFLKRTSIIHYSRQALQENASSIAAFARLEELEAHARAIEIRMEEDQ
ncbi:histidinol dehydrogenase [Aureibacillus halotolerans]|uniref:Histidinol dehydrogenase n=1 Tax=Aureibacillus halotolerans TaxID=1508390 RepID=A0A4R6TTH4_9BACI|nr:histidinol dehydrogenase [Aureibacillus halotolerans]TDQ36970.1 histidinol dehydrogenase [Aureibacillus halotolerans]